MWDNLPVEISTDILHRLPVKTLIKCTLLSKSFFSLITSQDFISTHIAKHTNSQLLLHYFTVDYKEIYHIEPDDDTFSGFQTQGLLVPFLNYNERFSVAGCVNGVICLVEDIGYEGTLIILWNPSIRKFVHVPKPIMVYEDYGAYESVCGFGFDSISDDYKVVRIVHLDSSHIRNPNETKPPTQVEVFNLKSGCWRVIGDGPSHIIKRHSGKCRGYIPCFINGFIYWVGYHIYGPDKYAILKFDVFTETFEIIKVPEILTDEEVKTRGTRPPLDFYVQECKGNLTLIKRNYKDAIKTCSVWLMKENGDVKTWTKMFDFDIAKLRPFSMPRDFAFRKNGEIIMVKDGQITNFSVSKRFVISTDLVTYDNTRLRDTSVDCLSFYLSTYVESMVLFKEGKGIGEQTTQLDLFPEEESEEEQTTPVGFVA